MTTLVVPPGGPLIVPPDTDPRLAMMLLGRHGELLAATCWRRPVLLDSTLGLCVVVQHHGHAARAVFVFPDQDPVDLQLAPQREVRPGDRYDLDKMVKSLRQSGRLR